MNIQTLLEFIKVNAVNYGVKIIGAIVIIIVGFWLSRLTTKLLVKAFNNKKVDVTLTKFLSSIIKTVLYIVVILAALDTLEFKTTSFVAIIGAAGLAVGFALQGSLSNFASGVMLIIFRPFKVGQYIEAGGGSGTVEEIGIFTTKLHSPDNKLIIIPNAKLTGDNIINYSANSTRRVDMVFGIGYSDDIDKAREAINNLLVNNTKILKDPAPSIIITELADSSVNFSVRPWVKTEDYWEVFAETHEAVKKKFDELNISIPFPQTDVHLFQNN